MKTNGQPTIPEILGDRAKIQKALREAVQDAVRTHKLLGQPIVIWRDGKVVWVPPEEIEVDEPTNGDARP
jgi:hypothetical protein